jgi:hypothetical protein
MKLSIEEYEKLEAWAEIMREEDAVRKAEEMDQNSL